MKITQKGQVTIPLKFRKRYGLEPRVEVEFAAGEDGVVIRPARTQRDRVRAWLAHARGKVTREMTTDQIMDLTRGEG